MIELELAGARHQIFALQLELLVEQIEMADYDPAVVGDDRACALGQWLYGPGTSLAHLPQYAEVLRTHERFHAHAGRMLGLFNVGDIAGAGDVMAGPYAEASRAVNAAIAQLKIAGRAEREGQDSKTVPIACLALGSDPALLTGVALIDAQHKEIAEIIGRLLVQPHTTVDCPAIADTLRELATLIALHFDSEELFMKHAGVPAPEIAAHQREHAELLRQYEDIALQPEMHAAAGPCDACLAVEQWMVDHIRERDLALKGYAHIPYP